MSKFSATCGESMCCMNSRNWSAVSINRPGSGSTRSKTPSFSACSATGLIISTNNLSAAAHDCPGATGPPGSVVVHVGHDLDALVADLGQARDRFGEGIFQIGVGAESEFHDGHSRSQALPGTALPRRLCLPSARTREAEPRRHCGPRQSLGPRM